MNKAWKSFFPQNYVTLITGHTIYLENVSEQLVNSIKEIGAFQDSPDKLTGQSCWVISYVNETDLAEKLDILSKLGFLFVDEPAGWPPAGIFDYLREKKLIEGKVKAVTWRGPGDWYIIER